MDNPSVSGNRVGSRGADHWFPQYQYVWSQRYIDAPVLRDKNTDADGLCDDERLYCLGDANFNVTTLVNTGAVRHDILDFPVRVLATLDARRLATAHCDRFKR